MASSGSQIDKPQCRRPKRAEVPDVNLKTGTQSINTERASLALVFSISTHNLLVFKISFHFTSLQV